MGGIKLFIFDVDHTITDGTTIWEHLHKECGTWAKEGSLYLKQFLAQEINFDEFSRRDARSWQGRGIDYLHRAQGKVQIMAGFPELLRELHKRNIATAIISSTVGQFAEYLAQIYGIDYCHANPLGLKNNVLDGTIDLRVKGEAKGAFAENLAKKLRLTKTEIAAAGDSRFDLPMFAHAEHSFILRNEKFKDKCKYFVKDFFEAAKLLFA
ncbi:phosphoserine phosphatase [Candidatus Termititenax persephonae]|uniref:phosphoserine phosphatase n=1 Tax=Candidatus Termititenax persephonae TaxID=2218525 RepID=A0A388TIE5_9BACT|nr:phosphoserine phosphatase [Candidatus Termititenax persephonae]